MADKNQEIKTNTPTKGLVTDLHENYISPEVWTYARNAVTNSHLGQIQFLQSEPSTIKCTDLPYQPIGFIRLLKNKWAVFMTDEGENHEIGIFDESNCTYSKLVNDPCLGFKYSNPIRGASKENFDCSESIYWTDTLNPRRYMNLSKIPYLYELDDDACVTKKYSDRLDCDSLLIEKNITVPILTVNEAGGGSLDNGTYQFGIAYAINNSRVTEYYSITFPYRIWSHNNAGKSLVVNFQNLDRDYPQFELILIHKSKQVTSYKSLGYYSTGQQGVSVSNIDKAEELDAEEVLAIRPRYTYADNVESNDQYLLFSGVRSKPLLDYQKMAMQIVPKYVVYQALDGYYRNGTKVGYMRDEVYAFAIQWLYKDGQWSDAFHIPAQKDPKAKTPASGKDVYEFYIQKKNGEPEKEIYIWRVSNTASSAVPILQQSNRDEKIIAEGNMGYYESTDLYPDNVEMFGEDACTPIRFPKMPDNTKIHHHSQDGKYIYILGAKFENIQHPKNRDGSYVSDIVGYRIVRADRRGNKSVQAKGLFSNVRSYIETNGTEVLYSNYGVNDLRPDNFISSKQTYVNNNSERDFVPLSDYKTDQFNFYSPDTAFGHIGLGNEVKFYTEEIAQVQGFFEDVYKHPKAKLLTQFDLYFALVIGAIDGFLSTRGKRCVTNIVRKSPVTADLEASISLTGTLPPIAVSGIGAGSTVATQLAITDRNIKLRDNRQMEQICDDIVTGINSQAYKDIPAKYIVKALQTLLKAGMFVYFALQTAQDVLDTIRNLSPWRQYAKQYNSHAFFNGYKYMPKDNTRRSIEYYQYMFDSINTVEGKSFNNFKREESVFIRVNDSIKEPSTLDNSRQTMADFKICDDPSKKVNSTGVMYYGAIKTQILNQYGQLDSIEYLDTGSYFPVTTPTTRDLSYDSPEVFGGDTFITRMTQRRSQHFFSQTVTDVPEGYVIDYRQYRNVGYPRYWIDTSPFDMSNFVSLSPKQSNTPRVKHNTSSCVGGVRARNISVVGDQYFFTSHNTVIDFFVESEYNLEYRDWKYDAPSFYSNSSSNLTQLFRSDNIEKEEEYIYDLSLSEGLLENTILQQRLDFSSINNLTCETYLKNRVIYSQMASKDQKADNWLVNLSENIYDFPMSEFGQLTSMQAVDNQQIMFLFDKASPYITVGRDELQMDGSGRTITLGDAGLFAREPRPISYTDFHYGNCQSKWAFANTQFGSFYPSQRQGRLFGFNGKNLEEISRNGMHYWFKNYMPSFTLKQFPTFKHPDNPIKGVALVSSFDPTDERYYVSKIDYSVLPLYQDKIKYNEEKDQFELNDRRIEFKDPEYFEDASWTISYSPKDQAFVSWHDWVPQFSLQGETHFMTVKKNAIWKHNENSGSFCNYYGEDKPFSLEFVVNNGQNVEMLRSVEYFLEVGKYFNNGRDFHMILDDNFDSMIISNNEQTSGPLGLVMQSKKDMSQLLGWPKYDAPNERQLVLYNKSEQKYRVNQFSDITNDRGEFSGRNYPLWITPANGYTKEVNMKAINFQKPVQLRKKFRNVWQKVMLTKQNLKEKKYIFKIANSKQLNSPR